MSVINWFYHMHIRTQCALDCTVCIKCAHDELCTHFFPVFGRLGTLFGEPENTLLANFGFLFTLIISVIPIILIIPNYSNYFCPDQLFRLFEI